MDFTFTETQTDAAALAATVFDKECTPERLKAADSGRFDRALWGTVAEAGLLGLSIPEEHGGAGLGVLEMCSVLVEAGRRLAPLPLTTHLPTALALAEFATPAVRGAWLPRAVGGDAILTSALAEERDDNPAEPTVRADRDGERWLLSGTKVVVPVGTVASLVAVPATTDGGVTVFLVDPAGDGVTAVPQRISDGSEAARLELDRAAVAADHVLGETGQGAAVSAWLAARLTVATIAWQLGVTQGALALTSAYAKTREQFGRPIGTFQAVSQRLADGYIDVLGAELTLWQAAWRLAEGLPAEIEVAGAKLWAADAGHRLAHTTVHVHGGVGIDLDGEAHRYFTGAKMAEFALGGTTEQARRIGALLAAEPV